MTTKTSSVSLLQHKAMFKSDPGAYLSLYMFIKLLIKLLLTSLVCYTLYIILICLKIFTL